MSFFWGELSFDNKVVDHLIKMQQSLEKYPCVKESIWENDKVGFGYKKRIFTHNSTFDGCPFTENNCTIVSHSRLDNSASLMQLLNIPVSLQLNIPDSTIILKSYQLWGINCVTKFKGDWSFVIWDENKQELILAVDHLSTNGIYYHHNKNQFLFANNKKPILAIKENPHEINEYYLIRNLLLIGNRDPQTIQKDLHFVPPGHYMVINSFNQLIKKRYWFPTRIKPIHYKNNQDYVDNFYYLYREAVKKRIAINCKIGSHLSGGLDSGTVSWLAADILKDTNKELTVFTGTNHYAANTLPHLFANEEYYAGLTVKASSNMKHEIIDAREITIFDSLFKSKEIFNELYHGAGNIYWILSIHERAKALGIPIILNGQIGNATVSWSGTTHKDKLYEIYAKQKEKLNILKSAISNKNYAYLQWKLFTKTKASLFEFSMFNPKYLQAFSFKLINLLSNDEIDADVVPFTKLNQLNLLRPRQSGIGLFWQSIGQEYNQQCWDPTNDIDLVEYCIAIPQHAYCINGKKSLIRSAFADKIPDEVIKNTKKGLQGADMKERFLLESNQINQYLQYNKLNNNELNSSINWKEVENIITKNKFKNNNLTQNNLVTLYKVLSAYILKN